MRELQLRDLHTELGAKIDETEDMESFLEIRLEMATIREKSARQVFEHVAENYKIAAEDLEAAKSKRIYWEGQLQKVQERNQPATAKEGPTTSTESRTYVVHTNGVSLEEIDNLIQEKAEVIKQLLMDADREGGKAYRTGGHIDLADYLAEGLAKAEEDAE